LGYDGERVDARVLDQLEATLRGVAEELAGWRVRAQKAEAELKELQGRGGGGPARLDPEVRNRLSDLDQENKALRQRVEAAKLRVHDLLGRLTFLEEQAREAGNGGARGSGGGGGGGTGAGSAAGTGTGTGTGTGGRAQ
jgi:cell division protein FtsB